LFFAGQITGVEGYVGNAATGLLAGINAARYLREQPAVTLPITTMLGALCHYITHAEAKDFQPMKANFGLMPPLEPHIKNKRARYQAYADRALRDLDALIAEKCLQTMRNRQLAQWLQEHTDMLGSISDKDDAPFHRALYEGLIEIALTGQTRMADSVVESAAAHAVATNRPLTSLLGVHQQLRQRTWDRIGEEIDPEPAFSMLSALDTIFTHIIRVTIDAYQNDSQRAHIAKSTEVSQLYNESEQKVMQYATEVARANRELARLEQAKTDFISIAAHELKTPLTLIQGYVSILQDLELSDHGQQLARGIERGVFRIDSILENMLDLSDLDMRRVKLTLQELSLRNMLEGIGKQFNQALDQRQQTLTVHHLDTLPSIEADAARIHQIFQQLVNNAIKFTPDGGQISISGALLNPADQVRVTIQDNGVGIAPEDREKVFKKFFRVGDSARHSTGHTKFMGGGPGLGLAIVRGLVEAHGGNIIAESQGFDMHNFPGSSFIVTLPVKADPPADIAVQWITTEGVVS
jgi:signal transduction histidine kinase